MKQSSIAWIACRACWSGLGVAAVSVVDKIIFYAGLEFSGEAAIICRSLECKLSRSLVFVKKTVFIDNPSWKKL